MSLEFEFHLQFPCGSPLTELSHFGRQLVRSGNECECKQTLKKHVPRLMTSLLMSSPPISISHGLFQCRYSNSRDIVASSASFSLESRYSCYHHQDEGKGIERPMIPLKQEAKQTPPSQLSWESADLASGRSWVQTPAGPTLGVFK